MAKIAFISYRFGTYDGVSRESFKWMKIFLKHGWHVYQIAGSFGDIDPEDENIFKIQIPELSMKFQGIPKDDKLKDVLQNVELVVVENICSLSLNKPISEFLANLLKDTTAIMHHHDFSWQRDQKQKPPPPYQSKAWTHVVINKLSQRQLKEFGFESIVIYNAFDIPETSYLEPGWMYKNLKTKKPLLLTPTRAIPRKNIPAALEFAKKLDAKYWLLGPAEDQYHKELIKLLTSYKSQGLEIWHGLGPYRLGIEVKQAYQLADCVILPSIWEGFGNPAIESALFKKPLVIGPYPVAKELEEFGFKWFKLDQVSQLKEFLNYPDLDLLEQNFMVAYQHFGIHRLEKDLKNLLQNIGLKLKNNH